MRIPSNLRHRLIMEAVDNGMKVLTWDIETSHAIIRTFSDGGKTYINHRQVKVPNKIISIQYKWLHESEARYLMWDRIDDRYDDSRNFDDSKMIIEFAENVLSLADIVIYQNGDAFDHKVLNERAKALQLCLLDQKPAIDILKLSRKSFKLPSHKLDYRSEQQGLGGKIQMLDDDWTDIEERGVSPEVKMIPYGLKDVMDTEELAIEKELLYYKDLPTSVEKVILSYIQPKKTVSESVLLCTRCRSNHRPSREIIEKDGKHHCKNCQSSDYVESR